MVPKRLSKSKVLRHFKVLLFKKNLRNFSTFLKLLCAQRVKGHSSTKMKFPISYGGLGIIAVEVQRPDIYTWFVEWQFDIGTRNVIVACPKF